MSDVSQGEGWWQASDGKWYPPTLTPGRTNALPAPTATFTVKKARKVPLYAVIGLASLVAIGLIGVAAGAGILSAESPIEEAVAKNFRSAPEGTWDLIDGELTVNEGWVDPDIDLSETIDALFATLADLGFDSGLIDRVLNANPGEGPHKELSDCCKFLWAVDPQGKLVTGVVPR